jgi:endonuclease G
MTIDLETMRHAREALDESVRRHLYSGNVTLVDLGRPVRDGDLRRHELAIRFHVREKLAGLGLERAVERGVTREIAPTIAGFPTDVLKGVYRPHSLFGWPWWTGTWARPVDPRAARSNPIRGGISISDAYTNGYGTLGGKVIDRTTGEEMVLSNWHVLVARWAARRGQPIYQPGRLDGGTSSDTVASLARDAMSVGLDAAVATVDGSRGFINDQLGLGPVTGVGDAELDTQVVKSGRRTGITHGRVTGIAGTATLSYNAVERVIRNVIAIDPSQAFTQVSAPGDSGSVWLEDRTWRALGLHFAGGDFPERALAIDLRSILDALNVELDTRRVEPWTRPVGRIQAAAPERVRRAPVGAAGV